MNEEKRYYLVFVNAQEQVLVISCDNHRPFSYICENNEDELQKVFSKINNQEYENELNFNYNYIKIRACGWKLIDDKRISAKHISYEYKKLQQMADAKACSGYYELILSKYYDDIEVNNGCNACLIKYNFLLDEDFLLLSSYENVREKYKAILNFFCVNQCN